MSDTKLWARVPTFKEEGTFKGVVTKIEFSPRSNTALVLFRKADANEYTPHCPEGMKPALYDFLFWDEHLLTGCSKCVIYQSGSRDIAVLSDENCISPYHFLQSFRAGSPVTIRTSRSWNGRRIYIRYMKDESTGKYFGHPEESDWRQRTHPFPFFPFSGTYEITVSHIDPIMDEDEQRVYRAEFTLPDDKLHHPYKAYIRMGSMAGKKISDPISAGALTGKPIKAALAYNPETERTTLDDFFLEEGKKKEKRERKERPPKSFADDKCIAERYPKLKSEEYKDTNGIYSATVVEIPGIDYEHAHDFIGFCLDDGRVVVPKIRRSQAKDFTLLKKEDNLFYDRKKISCGAKVILYFSPIRRGDYMMLRGIALAEA